MNKESNFSIKILSIASSFGWSDIFIVPDALRIRFSFKEPYLEYEVETFAAFPEILAPIKVLLDEKPGDFLIGTGFPMHVTWQDKENIKLTLGSTLRTDRYDVTQKYVFSAILKFDEFYKAIKDATDYIIQVMEKKPMRVKEDVRGKQRVIEYYALITKKYEIWKKSLK